MNGWQKIRGLINIPQDKYEQDEEFFEDEEIEEEVPTEHSSRQKKKKDYTKKKKPVYAAADMDEDEYRAFEPKPVPQKSRPFSLGSNRPNNVVDIHTTAKLQVVLTKPTKYTEAREIGDHLNEKRTVVLNLESAQHTDAVRILDFLSGVVYANDGEIKKIGKDMFIITPYNVDVSGDLLYELENNGYFFQ